MRQTMILAAMMIAVAACSDDPTGPDNNDLSADQRADVATTTGALVATDVGIMAHSEGSSDALFSLGGDLDLGSCSLLSGVITCTATIGTIEGELELEFTDATGADQDSYDDQTTAMVSADAEISGDLSGNGFEFEFEHEGEFTINGLAGTETSRTWDGVTSSSVSSSSFGGARNYTFSGSADFDTVVVPVGGSGPNWPTSGSFSGTIQLTPTSGNTRAVNYSVEFNGTSQVPLTVDGVEFTLDLETRAVISNN